MKHNDINAILDVHRLAFGDEEGPKRRSLRKTSSAILTPFRSVSERDGKVAGNVLFTPFALTQITRIQNAICSPLVAFCLSIKVVASGKRSWRTVSNTSDRLERTLSSCLVFQLSTHGTGLSRPTSRPHIPT